MAYKELRIKGIKGLCRINGISIIIYQAVYGSGIWHIKKLRIKGIKGLCRINGISIIIYQAVYGSGIWHIKNQVFE